MTKVLLTRRAMKDLERLDHPVRKRILEKLQASVVDLMRQSIKLTDAKLGTYRYRVGDYRVVFDVEGDTLVVLKIGHRRDVYS